MSGLFTFVWPANMPCVPVLCQHSVICVVPYPPPPLPLPLPPNCHISVLMAPFGPHYIHDPEVNLPLHSMAAHSLRSSLPCLLTLKAKTFLQVPAFRKLFSQAECFLRYSECLFLFDICLPSHTLIIFRGIFGVGGTKKVKGACQ